MLVVHPWSIHQWVFRKFLSLWLISSLPVIFATLFFPPGEDASASTRILHAFSSTHQFIYAVSFMGPLLFLLYEMYERQRRYIAARKRTPETLGPEPKGIGLVLLLAFLVFAFSTFAYGATNAAQSAGISSDMMTAFARASDRYSIWVYMFGLYCWYITLLIPTTPMPDVDDYVAVGREKENQLKQEFRNRLAKGGAE